MTNEEQKAHRHLSLEKKTSTFKGTFEEEIAKRQMSSVILERIEHWEESLDGSSVRSREVLGFIIHMRPWRETSLMLEVLTRDKGRLFLLAKGAKRAYSAFRGILQPFCPLALVWSGKNEVKVLQKARWLGTLQPRAGETLLSGFYLNELMLKLLEREDPHPELFNLYVETLQALCQGEQPAQMLLRKFEVDLLEKVGWAAIPFENQRAPFYCVKDGILVPSQTDKDAYPAVVVDAVIHREFDNPLYQRALRELLRALINHYAQSGSLKTRNVMRSLQNMKP